jgi:carbon monoxide dehydrogenase subunit G
MNTRPRRFQAARLRRPASLPHEQDAHRMDMTGERRITATRGIVWNALNDPEVLKASIPGCDALERTAEDAFQARVSIRMGPISAKFSGKVILTDIRPPAGYRIIGEGSGGAMGFAKGSAEVDLVELAPDETLLRYRVQAQVGGKIAQLGARLIDSTSKQLADQFFDRFSAQLAPAPVSVPVPPVLPAAEALIPQQSVAAAPASERRRMTIPAWAWIAAVAVIAAMILLSRSQ